VDHAAHPLFLSVANGFVLRVSIGNASVLIVFVGRDQFRFVGKL